jgi:FAD/FMN-containing dehydrogenase
MESYDLFGKSGALLRPGDAAFEEARQIWNARLAKTPAAILQCTNAADVAAGMAFAKDQGLAVSVRGGGHSYAGLASRQDALMIDLSRMQAIEIAADSAQATVGAGVRWGDFYEAALPHGLCPAGGTVSSVGVSGFTLGGGSGWLTRKHGLALDNLVAVEAVTADGQIVTASESENADLFWGIRGSAGNLAIVTRFTFRLHPVPAEIFAGQVIYPLERAREAIQVFRDVMASAPDAFNCYPATFRVPPIEAFPAELHGQVVLDFIFGHMGDAAEGEAVAQPLREIGEPLIDTSAVQPLGELFKVFDAGTPPGQRWYSRSRYIDGLSDDAVDVFLEHSLNMQGPFTFAYFEVLGGADGRVAPDATAFPHRDMSCDYHILAGWPDGEGDEGVMAWVRDFHDAMAPFATGGVYVNLLAEDEPDRIREAYGGNWDRLVQLKQKWDPDNRLSGNQNISPA